MPIEQVAEVGKRVVDRKKVPDLTVLFVGFSLGRTDDRPDAGNPMGAVSSASRPGERPIVEHVASLLRRHRIDFRLYETVHERQSLGRARPILRNTNRRWAEKAPLLIFVFARRNHPETGQPLATGAFDTGAAWFSLAMQAQRLGLRTHAMGGIYHDRVHDALGVPIDLFQALVGIAVGYPGLLEDLPAELRERERPTSRKRQAEFVFHGRYAPRVEGQNDALDPAT